MLGAILVGLALAGLVYLAYRVTTAFLRNYRKKKQSQIILAEVGDMIHQMPNKEKRKFSLEDLDEISDEQIIAEYNEDTDEVVQAQFVGSEGIDSNIQRALNNNDGFIIIED